MYNEKGAKICRCAFRNAAETRSQPETVRDYHKEGPRIRWRDIFLRSSFGSRGDQALWVPAAIGVFRWDAAPLLNETVGLGGTLEGTVRKEYAKVTASRMELPKKEVQEIIKEIWGEMPKGFCV